MALTRVGRPIAFLTAAVLALLATRCLASAEEASLAALAASSEEGPGREGLLCLGGGSGSQACGEDQVEAAEDQWAETMSVELLQRDLNLKNTKVSHELQLDDVRRQQQVVEGNVTTESKEREDGTSQDLLATAADEEEAEWDGEEEFQEPAIDCSAHPVFCDPKVNCAENPITAADRTAWAKKLATKDGHANPHSWCMVYPMYSNSLGKCIVDNDKIEYARIMYEDQGKANLNAADAVYCFVAGHCNSTDVTLNTTEQEAEKICDAKYGHRRWTSVGWNDFMGVVSRAQTTLREGQQALRDGNKTWSELLEIARKEAEISAMTSCAMGIYQCDVFYCKNNYCNNDLYRSQFGNMSWASV